MSFKVCRPHTPPRVHIMSLVFVMSLLSGLSVVQSDHMTSFCPDKCECFNNDETVDCSRADLTDVPPLHDVTKRMYLEDNRVARLSAASFNNASNLCLLVIERNELTEVQSEEFCGLVKLQELQLGGNRLRSFIVDTSPGSCTFPALKELDLSLNLLQTIPQNLALFSPNLEILNLSYNEIMSFVLDPTYARLTALRYLDLSRNRVHQLGPTDLWPLGYVSMEILNLAECGLTSVDEHSLSRMNNLTSLSLSGNMFSASSLTKILTNFAPNSSLARLDISEITLPNLTLSTLASFQQLVIIDAAYCDLEHIDPRLFHQLADTLETLHLEGGKLQTLENLSVLQKLRRLHLQENRIEWIEVFGLHALESLDLSYNRLRLIPARWLTDVPSLQLLNLSHNRITTIEADCLLGVNIISTLDISFNAVESLQNLGLIGLVRLDASNNVVREISNTFLNGILSTLNEINLSGNQLIDLSRFDSSENISYSEENTAIVKILNLSNNKISNTAKSTHISRDNKAPPVRSQFGDLFRRFASLEVLDLSLNGISRLDCDDLHVALTLNDVNLRNNNVTNLNDVMAWCAPSLTKLTLAANQIRLLDVDTLARLGGTLQDVDLSDNPFHCDCNLVPFIHWANKTNAIGGLRINHFSDWSGYQCHSPMSVEGSYLFTQFTVQKICPMGSMLTSSNPNHVTNYDVMKSKALRFVAVAVGVLGVTLLGVVVLGVVTWRRCHVVLEGRMKMMRYRWQVRYSEVSDLDTVLDSAVGLAGRT